MKDNHTICFVFGTRPEIIKLAPVIHECIRRNISFITIHTGQHYSENMDSVFMRDLKVPEPTYNLRVGSGNHGEQTAKMLVDIEKILLEKKPDVVVVQGDTNSVLAGALAATKLHIKVAHVEAGLRSYDKRMPEEINRIVAGISSSIHFSPTIESRENLLREAIPEENIYVTGNTVVDAVLACKELAKQHSNILETLTLNDKEYGLVTIHRPENTDSLVHMKNILKALKIITKKEKLPLVWPMHPRTKKQIEIFNLTEELNSISELTYIEPIGFFDMISLQANAKVAITDSGGVQEESCILETPCVTLRSSTERPESVDVGANILAGNDPHNIEEAVGVMLKKNGDWLNPFGDGSAAIQIVDVLQKFTESRQAIQIQNEELAVQKILH